MRDQIDLNQVLILGLSFFAGTLFAIGVFSGLTNSEETELAAPEAAVELEENVLARQAQDAADEIAAEVAGVVCEDRTALIDETSSAGDVIVAWNATVLAAGDECTPAFDDALGATWIMTEAGISIFGNAGSVYELSSDDDGLATGLSIALVADDSSAGERDVLISAIETLWGASGVDWESSCADTESAWAGTIQSDGQTVELSRC